ncbi:TolC family protein [bacterium]|nr:TolC family protein [bacterium]
MKAKIFGIGSFLLCTSLFASAQNDTAWDLQFCIEYALEHNLTIQQAEKQVEIQENNLSQSKYSRYPTLNASSNLNFNIGRSIDPFTNTFENQTIASNSFSLTSGITLYSGNRINSTIKMNEAAYRASKYGKDVAVNQIKLAVVSAYLQIVQSEESLKNAESQKEITESQLERSKKLYKAGNVDQGAVLNLQAQLANDQVQIVTAQNQVQIAYNNMANLLQVPIDQDFRIKVININEIPEMPLESIATIYAQALSLLPEIQQSELQMEQAKFNQNVAQSAFLPTVSAYGNVNTVYSESAVQPISGQINFRTIGLVSGTGQEVVTAVPVYQEIPYSSQLSDNLGQTVGVSVSIPILNGGRNATNFQNAKLNYEIAEIQLENSKNTLRSDITTAYTNLMAAKSRYTAAVSSEEAQRKNYEYSQKRFDAGLLNSTELLNAKNNWFMAQTLLVNAKYEYVFRNLLIKFYQGESLQLN